MGTRIDLYALPGLPLQVDDLMPQSLLAKCAGTLSAQGHRVTIFDAGSVDRLERCGVAEVAAFFHTADPSDETTPNRWSFRFASDARRTKRLLQSFRVRRVADAIHATAEEGTAALAVIQIQRRKDVPDARELARALKRANPTSQVAIVGSLVTRYSRLLMMGAPEFDVACPGPAEAVLTSLARALHDRSAWPGIQGLIFRENERLAAGTPRALPLHPGFALPDYHPARYPAMTESGKIKIFTLTQSSGLSHIGHYRGDGDYGLVQVRETRHLRAEVEQVHALFGARAFHIAGEHTPPESVEQFAAECGALSFDICYSRDADFLHVGSHTVSALARSGCHAVRFAALTGSQHLLTDFYGEAWTVSGMEEILRHCKRAGLFLHADFIYPCPGDDYHSRAETSRLIRRCQPCSVRFRLPEVAPGSAWYQHAREFGFGMARKKLERWVSAPSFTASPTREAASLPFTVGRAGSMEVADLVASSLSEIDEMGTPHAAGVAPGLMARVAGEEGEEAAYIEALQAALLYLNIPQLHEIIEYFNLRATASVNTIDLFRPVPVKKVVGN